MLGEAGKDSRRMIPVESNAQYLDPGFLVFAHGGTLVGQRFDAVTAQVTGQQFAIADAVRFFPSTSVATFAASRSGSLVYQSTRNRNRDHLGWLDRSGREEPIVGSVGDYLDVRIIKPSGSAALLSRMLPATGTVGCVEAGRR